MHKFQAIRNISFCSLILLLLGALSPAGVHAQVLTLLKDAAKLAEQESVTEAASLRTLSTESAPTLRNMVPAERAQLTMADALTIAPSAPYLQIADDGIYHLYVREDREAPANFTGRNLDEVFVNAKTPSQKAIIVDYSTALAHDSELQSLSAVAHPNTFISASHLAPLTFDSTPLGWQTELSKSTETIGNSHHAAVEARFPGAGDLAFGVLLLLIMAWILWDTRQRKVH